jgi:hypothetical protein
MSENTETTELPRIQLLREAAAIVAGERNVSYGEPEDNFKRIAQIWSVILGMTVTPEDAAMCMVGLKVARYGNRGTFQPDTWRDIAGYAGCGYEVGFKNNV